MHKILIKVDKNKLVFSLYLSNTTQKNLNNTNVINTEKMIFSDEYINENLDLVQSFFNLIVLKKEINCVEVKINAIFPLVYRIINNIEGIKDVVLVENKQVSFIIFDELLNSKYIKSLDCYSIPNFMMDKLSRDKDIDIKTRCEVLFLSNFMETNNFGNYSDIYYRKSVTIDCKLSDIDKEDIDSFLRLNSKLREVYLLNADFESFKYIFDRLVKNNRKNIRIYLVQLDNSPEIMKLTDKIVNKYKKELKYYNCKLKIKYTEEYKNKNTMKQVNLNFLRMILLIFIILSIIFIALSFKKTEEDKEKIEDELGELSEFVEIGDDGEIINDPNETEEQKKDDKKALSKNSPYIKKFKQDWEKLKEINNETVGWLKVNNTKINLPITQHKDNEYYLNNSFYKKKNYHGWVFVDYRNDMNNLDDNTIIYGHRNNMGIMFGTLKNVLNKSWYKNKDNQVITFNTPKQNMKWQIFSIYTIKNTTDYLTTNFSTSTKYNNFVNKIKKRSVYNFNVKVENGDKILTLSTCYKNSNNRLVIHAKLIK